MNHITLSTSSLNTLVFFVVNKDIAKKTSWTYLNLI